MSLPGQFALRDYALYSLLQKLRCDCTFLCVGEAVSLVLPRRRIAIVSRNTILIYKARIRPSNMGLLRPD